MQDNILTRFLLLLGLICYLRIRGLRFSLPLVKVFLFFMLVIPPVAHFAVGWDWDPSQYSGRDWKMRNEVASGLMAGTFISVAVLALALDPARSWRSVGVQLAVLNSIQLFSGAAMLYWVLDDISFEHFEFLIKKSPFIVARYISRLPWDGWSQLTEFAELLVLAYKQSKGMSLQEIESAQMTALEHSDGQILSNITAPV